MQFVWQSITDVNAGRALVARARYGVIETHAGQLVKVHFRPWPKLFSWPELWPTSHRYHKRGHADRCWLYFNQPRSASSFLAVRYMESTPGTSFATFRAALRCLDQVAAIKRTDAAVCDAANIRLTDRLMHRLGWESHKPQRWHRNFIRRYYGVYPLADSEC